MTRKEMLAFAIYLTTDMTSQDGKRKTKRLRDLYYNPIKRIFVYRPANNRKTKNCQWWHEGRITTSYISKACIFVGRYEMDVNPNWIIEDMLSVQ